MHQLTIISLNKHVGNNIGDDGATALAQALTSMKSLEDLWLDSKFQYI